MLENPFAQFHMTHFIYNILSASLNFLFTFIKCIISAIYEQGSLKRKAFNAV